MTIKEFYEYSKVNGFENLPFRYGYIDDDGVYRPHDFGFSDFEYDAEEVTLLFSESALRALADEMSEKVTMEYAGDEYGIDSYCCSYCEKEVIPDMYNYCPGCGRKIKEWR